MGLLDFLRQPRAIRDAISAIESEPAPAAAAPQIRAVSIDDLPPVRSRHFGGEKFSGGMGAINVLTLDYWTLRARSSEFFASKLFARGIIRRLTTAVVTAGLYLECTPQESLLGLPEDSLAEWAEDVESRFAIWGKDPFLADASEQLTFGALQSAAWREALISGDVLVTLVSSPRTKIPRIRLIRGDAVQTPMFGIGDKLTAGHKVTHGVELDASGRQVAYWITQEDGSSKRLPAWGEKSGRRLAWLVYATDKRLDEVRGQPLLALVLQSIGELDKYRDSTQRKALVNSFLAAWIQKSEDKPGSRGLSMGAVVAEATTTTSSSGSAREYNAREYLPGMIVEELQTGETIHQTGGNGTDEKYGDFEEAIIQGIAWALEIPPEILRLSFSSNYSASKAAENNFAVYLFQARTFWGEQFCQPVYVEWLLAETLAGNIKAAGLLDSWRDPLAYVTFGSWTLADWSGNVKPSVDPVKQVNAYKLAIGAGLISPSRACREFSGQKQALVMRELKKYFDGLKAAGVPEVQPKPVPAPPARALSSDEDDEAEDDDEREEDAA
jgi:lambda family phage portal protein